MRPTPWGLVTRLHLPKRTPMYPTMAQWVLQALNQMGLEQFHLYGSHTGAHIAVELALSQPKRVKKVVVDGIAMFNDDEKQRMLSHYAPVMTEDDIGSQMNWTWHFVRDQAIYFPYFDRCRAKLRNVDMPNAGTLHKISVEVLKALHTYHLGYRAAFRHPDRERLPLLQQPTLVTAFANDPLCTGVDIAAGLIPDVISNIVTDNTADSMCHAISEFLSHDS